MSSAWASLLAVLPDGAGVGALVSVILIDVTLAGDNAIVVGLAVAGLPPEQRTRAVAIGLLLATVLRIALSLLAAQLLMVIGLTLAGGVLLLWVGWKMLREFRHPAASEGAADPKPKSLRAALTQIVLADLSMSLDNVLAVAGTAREHLWVLVAGLALSVALMGAASALIARLLQRHHWIAWIGLALILYVAVAMIYDGSRDVIARLG